jgi:hypothetical protein
MTNDEPPGIARGEPWMVRYARACLGLLKATSYQGSICLAFASTTTIIALAAKVPVEQIPLIFLAFMPIPLPFVKHHHSPRKLVERELVHLNRLVRNGTITKSQYKRYEKVCLDWYASQLPASFTSISGIGESPPKKPEVPAKRKRRR